MKITETEATSLVWQISVSLKSAARLVPVNVRVDWKQEQFKLWFSSTLTFSIVEMTVELLEKLLIAIVSPDVNEVPSQISTFRFIILLTCTTHMKMTLLGSDVALAQSALDVMVGESTQTGHSCPVH